MLRMRETVLEMIVELADMTDTIIDLMILRAIRHRKLDLPSATHFFEKFKAYFTRALYVERLVFLESLMPPMLRVLNRIHSLSKSSDPVNL